MMDAVGEHEQSPKPSGQQSGPPAVRPSSEPAPVDPELRRQFEQFQQFQQFQELQRRQGDQAQPPAAWPPPAPPAKPPVWRRLLRSWPVRKLASVVVSLLVILLALYFAVDYFFGKENQNAPASQIGGQSDENRRQRRTQPDDIVRAVYWKIAENDAVVACVQFTDEAKRQFADNNADKTGGAKTCEQAVPALRDLVTNANQYYLPKFPPELLRRASDGVSPIEISSCVLTVTGGPKLGWFKVELTPHLGQWIITEHRKETCPDDAGSTTPTG